MIVPLLAVLASIQLPDAPESAPTDTIVVTGQRPPTPRDIDRHVGAISQSRDGQIARFMDPICPDVIGMPDPAGGAIAQRIRTVTAMAGLRVEPPGCRPNLTLIVTPNGRRMVEALQRERPLLFAGLEPGEARRLSRAGPAVRTWRQIEVTSDDGAHLLGPRCSELPVSCLRVSTSSITQLQTRQVVRGAVVVIEDAAALGKSLRQIADYVVMRALAGARVPDDSPIGGDSILSLFESGATPPRSLTNIDMAYLSALYRVRPTETRTGGINAIANLVRRAMARARAEDRPASQP